MKGLHLLGLSAAMSAVLIFAASQADAQRRGGGGGGGRQVRASSSGSINGAANRSASANRSVNRGGVNNSGNRINTGDRNVTINNNIDVDVDNNNGWGGYHPVARGAAVAATTAVVMGAYYSSLPSGCVTVVRNGISYSQCGSTWYQPVYSGNNVQYMVVAAP